jgi:alpha-beta hydrolase superfamily lysophospholipase
VIIDVFSYLPTTVHMRYMLNTFATTPDYLYNVFGKTIAQVCGISPEEFQQLKQLPHVHAFAEALAARAGEGYALEKFVQDLERTGVARIVVHGEDDASIPVDHAYRTYEELDCEKELVVFPSGQSGSAHCQQDNLTRANEVIFDWLVARMF